VVKNTHHGEHRETQRKLKVTFVDNIKKMTSVPLGALSGKKNSPRRMMSYTEKKMIL